MANLQMVGSPRPKESHKKPSAREGFYMAHSAGFELTTF